jgi:hypothetical protein
MQFPADLADQNTPQIHADLLWVNKIREISVAFHHRDLREKTLKNRIFLSLQPFSEQLWLAWN